MVDGDLLDFELHFERLRKGVEFVYGPFSDAQDWVLQLKGRIQARCATEEGDKVLRITVYRDQARGLHPTSMLASGDLKLNFHFTPPDPEALLRRALRLRSCPVNSRPAWWPSYLKAGSYLETILSQKVHLKPEDDDLLFLSRDETILESSVANIFLVRHNRLYTAPPGPTVLDGVMRKKILGAAAEFFDGVREVESTLSDAVAADAVFGSNSLRGPFLVSHVDGREIAPARDFHQKFDVLWNRVMR